MKFADACERGDPPPGKAPTLVDRKGSAISQGSGFVLTSDGLAGSNYHVLEGATRALASCSNGRVLDVGLIDGADLDRDIVVFQLYTRGSKVKPHDLARVTLGSSTDLIVGEKVIAIGSPQGWRTRSVMAYSAQSEKWMRCVSCKYRHERCQSPDLSNQSSAEFQSITYGATRVR